MRMGLYLPSVWGSEASLRESVGTTAEDAEAAGFSSLWAADHFFIPSAELEAVGQAGEIGQEIPELWTWLTFCAARPAHQAGIAGELGHLPLAGPSLRHREHTGRAFRRSRRPGSGGGGPRRGAPAPGRPLSRRSRPFRHAGGDAADLPPGLEGLRTGPSRASTTRWRAPSPVPPWRCRTRTRRF